jgi:hypothetical protein
MAQTSNPLLPTTSPYGTDLGTFPNPAANGAIDLDPGMIECTGRTLLAQSLVRRQTTPTGSVIDCPNDCLDLRGWLSNGLTQSQIQAQAGVIKTELLKDERVLDAQVQLTYNFATQTLVIVENITSGYGPFSMTLTVNAVTVTVLMSNQSGATLA